MKRRAGFTLIEMAIVMAVVALLAVVTGASFANARKNASAGSTAFEISLRFQGLKTRALQEQMDYVAVVVNPAGSVSTGCRSGSDTTCARLVVLGGTPPGWTLAGFDPHSPGASGTVDEIVSLDASIVLDAGGAGLAAAAPFGAIVQLPATMSATCSTGPCIAIRFGADGRISPVYPGAAPATAPTGAALGFTSDSSRQYLSSRRRAVLVTFPTGIVKTYTY